MGGKLDGRELVALLGLLHGDRGQHVDARLRRRQPHVDPRELAPRAIERLGGKAPRPWLGLGLGLGLGLLGLLGLPGFLAREPRPQPQLKLPPQALLLPH